ncbi:MAG: hypothetical protein K8T25_14545 [Planctomycetia bacterium]|nr:hypothetical protein [Planctomycetia bacterium]
MRFGCACLSMIPCLVWSLASGPSAAAADETFPYTAYVSSDNVYVRSGPGKNYYPTEKLSRGTEVEVYRHDPGGWFAIRPPQGSFAWLPAKSLRQLPEPSHVAEVLGDLAPAMVGSRFSDVRDVCQVYLDRGERVEVLGQQQLAAEGTTTAEAWCRIAPPRGEFRWVSAQFVTRQGPAAPNQPAPNNLTTNTPSSAPSNAPATIEATPKTAAVVQPASHVEESVAIHGATAGWTAASGAAPNVQQVAAVQPVNGQPVNGQPTTGQLATGQPAAVPATTGPARDSQGREVVAMAAPGAIVAPAGAAPSALQSELDDIDLKLSQMIAEEPSVWQFDALKTRANTAAATATSALERGRAHEAIRQIQQYEAIRKQYVDLSALRQQTDRQTTPLAQAAAVAAASVSAPPVEQAKYDGIGRLTPVTSRRSGAPRYALTDSAGGVVAFVTPAADVSLQPYVGQVVGLTGSRGYMPQLAKPHLTAKRITPLDASVLR